MIPVMKYSFQELRISNKGIHVLYTEFARADNLQTEEDLLGLFRLLDTYTDRKWVWIIDFKDMTYSKCMCLSYISRLVAHMQEVHATSLDTIYILNVNTWVQTLLSLFATKKVRILAPDETTQIHHLVS